MRGAMAVVCYGALKITSRVRGFFKAGVAARGIIALSAEYILISVVTAPRRLSEFFLLLRRAEPVLSVAAMMCREAAGWRL
jgi:hypothetical protein